MTSTRIRQWTGARGTALITGAGSGIGAAITEQLASRGVDLVLVARDVVRLEAVAARLRAEHRAEVRTVPLDLSRHGAPAHLAELLRQSGTEVDILVNNAAVALVGAVGDADPARTRALVDLNAGAVAETTALFLPGMLARGQGAIVNIASTAAYAPAPYNAAYAASKAFVLSFSRALWYETRGTGVRVVAVSPGAVETPMNPGRGRGKRRPGQVADTVVAALRGRAPSVVDGGGYALQAFVFSRVLPWRTAARLTGNFFRAAARRARP
ncbi:SDR family NAD(P)-dependent oxidoreductase [Streptomyces sp. 8L]|uniref:SDR family NAD(P)-dependent oxidoreductase n=1 Tax=Streptomyces sp. 8L TaxID=2877242 RepID=UPI001CD6F117|nr:SDR family NAD(P)-dependent oxidoreductase [Streptomyces sp. 8L]MCA1223212.1 SDR family NAD(P)-dependent oxidoreductase [Streptomyces sp. 8L]